MSYLSAPLGHGEWYVIQSGEQAGKWHMQGWFLHAHLGTPTHPGSNGWMSWGVCPRCYAMVFMRPGDVAFSPDIEGHEDWHHRTDYPHP
jgi:hypothetical protein